MSPDSLTFQFAENNSNAISLTEGKTNDELEKLDDFSLLKMAREGAVEAFEVIYHRHYRRVYSLCLRMLNDASEADFIESSTVFEVNPLFRLGSIGSR